MLKFLMAGAFALLSTIAYAQSLPTPNLGGLKINGTTENFPASGNLVGTTDSQTLTNKSISATEVNSGQLSTNQLPPLGDVQAISAGTLTTSFTNTGTGAAAETVGAKLKLLAVNAEDFGMVADGTTDNRAALNNALAQGARQINLGTGTYLVNLTSGTSLAAPPAGTTIQGVGTGNTILKIVVPNTTFVTAFNLTHSGFALRNMTVQFNVPIGGDAALFGLAASNVLLEDAEFSSNTTDGILMGGTATNGDAIHAVFASTALTGTPITITINITTGETTTQMATAMASAINANAVISAAGIVATGSGAFVEITQPDTLKPQASWTTSITGTTETATVEESNLAILVLPNSTLETDNVTLSNVSVHDWSYTVLKANSDTSIQEHWQFLGGNYNRILNGCINLNSPSGTFDDVEIIGITCGSVGTNSTGALPIGAAHVTNLRIIGNNLAGTYNQNVFHFEENVNGMTMVGNTALYQTSTALGAGYAGTCIYTVDNNVGGSAKGVSNMTVDDNVCKFSSANQSGYGVWGAISSAASSNISFNNNIFNGFVAGAKTGGWQHFIASGNTFTNFGASSGTIGWSNSNGPGLIGPNHFNNYGTDISNGAGTTGAATSCSGTPTSSYASVNGIVTHC